MDIEENARDRSTVNGGRVAVPTLVAFLAFLAFLVAPACNLVVPGEDEAQEPEGPTDVGKLTAELDSALSELSRLRAQNKLLKVASAARAAAEAEGLILIEKARLVAIKHAQENKEIYPSKYRELRLVWEVDSALEQREFFYVYLLWRPFGFVGTPGREEFIMDKTGVIEFRQVLEEPLPEAQPAEEGQ